ncbi:Pectate lyase [Bertholletia excelsa]
MAANRLLLLLVAFAAILPTFTAHIGHFDDVWKARADQARNAALEAYESDPSHVANALNTEVRRSNVTLASHFHLPANSTRRYLKGKLKAHGPCIATNPIDRCWRCQPDWHLNRKRLADCVLGFGYKTTGGKDGQIYVVTDHTDDCTNPKPGTLRHAVIQKEPLWIIFAQSMRIRLTQELMVQSHKTIDGRGAHVTIAAGAGITLQFVQNVIIHNIHITNIQVGTGGLVRDAVDHLGWRTQSDGDGISIFGSSNIWLDHLSMSNCRDGLIDAIEGSTAITISNSHFTDHHEVMLFGAHDSSSMDEKMQVTVAFNHFGKRLLQRMPRCRWGLFHVVNNDYTHWNMYAIGGSMHPTIISQGNRFIAPDNIHVKEITKREATPDVWKHWVWRSQGDLMMNGAFFVESGDPNGAQILYSKMEGKAQIVAEPGTSVTTITRFAGALSCVDGKPC